MKKKKNSAGSGSHLVFLLYLLGNILRTNEALFGIATFWGTSLLLSCSKGVILLYYCVSFYVISCYWFLSQYPVLVPFLWAPISFKYLDRLTSFHHTQHWVEQKSQQIKVFCHNIFLSFHHLFYFYSNPLSIFIYLIYSLCSHRNLF